MSLSYPTEQGPSCPACTSGAFSHQGTWKSVQGDYDLYKCGDCRLRFSWPMQPGSADFYASCPFYSARPQYRLLSLKKILSRDWRIRQFRALNLPKGRLLDVGCGHGEMVRAASLMGYEAFGVDMDEKAIAIARKLGIPNVSVGRAEDSKEGPFDIVTCLDVLEHLQNPVGVLRDFGSALAPGGCIVISVPAWDRGPFLCCVGTDNPPHHLTMWTETAVNALAVRAGYDVVEMIRKPYSGQDFMVRCRHEWPWINRDIFVVKALRRLLMVPFVASAALLRTLLQCQGATLLAVLSTAGQTR